MSTRKRNLQIIGTKMERAMNFNMPVAAFGGLALIAAAIYLGPGSHSATAQSGGVQKIAICNEVGNQCAAVVEYRGGDSVAVFAHTLPVKQLK